MPRGSGVEAVHVRHQDHQVSVHFHREPGRQAVVVLQADHLSIKPITNDNQGWILEFTMMNIMCNSNEAKKYQKKYFFYIFIHYFLFLLTHYYFNLSISKKYILLGTIDH